MIITYIQIICGLIGLFFGAIAFFTFIKIKKIVNSYSEEELKEFVPFIDIQTKKVSIYILLLIVFTVASLILNYIK